LNDKTLFSFAECGFELADDALGPPDRYPVTYVERRLVGHMSGRDDLVAPTQLVPVRRISHGRGTLLPVPDQGDDGLAVTDASRSEEAPCLWALSPVGDGMRLPEPNLRTSRTGTGPKERLPRITRARQVYGRAGLRRGLGDFSSRPARAVPRESGPSAYLCSRGGRKRVCSSQSWLWVADPWSRPPCVLGGSSGRVKGSSAAASPRLTRPHWLR
jgi:hypothetical protein